MRATLLRKVSYIYFIYAPLSGRMKIGYTRNYEQRFTKIQSNSPEELQLLRVIKGSCQLERMLHKLFSAEREHGEWFKASESMISFVKSLDEMKLYKDVFEVLEIFRKYF